MVRQFLLIGILVVAWAISATAKADLLGYWSANATGGQGNGLPNDQGNGALDGELIEVSYTSEGGGFTGGPGDYALSFPGEDGDYVVIPPTEIEFDEITITAWVKGIQAGAWAGIVTSRDPTQAVGMWVHDNLGSLTYVWNDNNQSTWGFSDPALTIPEDQWSFVAVTVSEENAGLHVGSGGAFVTVVNDIEHIPQPSDTEWRLGEDNCCGTERNFRGLIDDVSIWNERLEDGQLEAIFRGELFITPDGLGSPSADFNDDGFVDDLDFAILAAHFGSTDATFSDGDMNFNRLVNLADFRLFKNSNAGLTSVPEPASYSILALGAVVALGLRIRIRSRASEPTAAPPGPRVDACD